jgi:lipopolysaccharide export system permease protein
MITIIDRYIAKMFTGFFIGGLVVFVMLFLTVDFMSNLVRFNAPVSSLIEYYTYFAPGVAYQMTPVACLFATIFTLGALSKSNELVALFSSGMSLIRISFPIIFIVIFISGAVFFVNDRLMPIVNQRKNYIYYVEIRKTPGLYSTMKTDRIWYRSGNILFNIKTLHAEKNSAQGLTMYYFDGAWQLMQIITADSVNIEPNGWELADGAVTLFTSKDATKDASKDASVPLTQSFVKKTITVNEDVRDLQKSSQGTDTLSLSELKRYITRNKESGLDTLRYEVDYHAKFSFACAALVMSFLGIPFSVSKQRSGGAAFNVGVTLILAFGYWAAYSSGIILGQHGLVAPMLAVWLPNLAMILLSMVFIVKLKR